MEDSPLQAEKWRYDRQEAFAPLGRDGQRRLERGRVLIVGVGGLGSWMAELLARAGVGTLRMVDEDRVDWTNLHRQAMFNEADAQSAAPKARAAAEHLRRINRRVSCEPLVERVETHNLPRLAEGMDLILDGTDNFATRFLLNDYAVESGTPWIFAGVAGARAQSMTILPGRTACLRCVYECPPEAAEERGLLGPVVAAMASVMASEAMKILSGRLDDVNRRLWTMDLWTLQVRSVALPAPGGADCPCCGQHVLEFYRPIVD